METDLFTAYTPLIHSLLTAFALLFSLGAIAYALYLRRCFFKETPTNQTIRDLKLDVVQLSGEMADLTDRFSRFQKREGMRNARAEKTTQQDLLADAEKIIAGGATGSPGAVPGQPAPGKGGSPKKALYDALRKRSH